MHAVHGEVVAVLQRCPALLVFSGPATPVVFARDAAKASVAVPVVLLAVTDMFDLI